jgi:hypothetical protein
MSTSVVLVVLVKFYTGSLEPVLNLLYSHPSSLAAPFSLEQTKICFYLVLAIESFFEIALIDLCHFSVFCILLK